MTDEKEESVEVAKYDRAMLERTEVQPIAEEDGHTIFVDGWGRFGAKVAESEIKGDTLHAVREKVHRAHMALKRKLGKKKVAKAAVIIGGPDQDSFNGAGFFTGHHAGNGRLMWREPDGSKGSSDRATVFARDDEAVPPLLVLVAIAKEAKQKMDAARKEIRIVCDEQSKLMYKGENLGYGRRPTCRSIEQANQLTERILTNIFGEEAD